MAGSDEDGKNSFQVNSPGLYSVRVNHYKMFSLRSKEAVGKIKCGGGDGYCGKQIEFENYLYIFNIIKIMVLLCADDTKLSADTPLELQLALPGCIM